MGRWSLPVMVVAMAALLVSCNDDDDVTTMTTSTSTSMPSTTSTTPTTTTAADRTTTSESAPTTTAPSTTVAPPTSIGVFLPVPDGTPPPQPIDEQPSASGLQSLTSCDPNLPANPAVTLTWVAAGSGDQLLAVSTLPDGFDSGRYTVTDELAPDITSHQISPIEPGGIYYWRVLTRSGDRWLSSVQASFTGPVCVLDNP